MGFYEPFLVLAFLVLIYAATCVLGWRVKRKLLWWSVAIIIGIGAFGITHNLIRTGGLGVPAFSN